MKARWVVISPVTGSELAVVEIGIRRITSPRVRFWRLADVYR